MADMVDYSLLHQNQNVAEEDELNDRVTAADVNLPPELIYEILCRLPAKSVGRFRCVSKDWQFLLSSRKFLKNQFNFTNRQTKMIICRNNKFFSINVRSDCTNYEGHPVVICEALNFKTTNLMIRISGSCNGLILLYDFLKHDRMKSALSIVNPITHKVLQLPAMPRNVDRFPVFGFGYCLNDDEYTVIIVSDCTRSSPVYMLKNNLWKKVEDSPPLALCGCGTFVDGSIHWLGCRYVDNSYVVCAFDLASERFREVEKPEGLKKNDKFFVNVLDGCLCLVCHTSSTSDIWVMKKYGLRDSWTKYTFEVNLHPWFFWNGDESIVAESNGRLIICCLKQKTSAIIPIRELSPEFRYGEKWTFVDSLFSPDSNNALEGSNHVQI